MTFKDIVLKWDTAWRYDYWWRKKYKIPFNSEQHRNANQIDIAFEYLENHLSNKALDKYKNDEDRASEYKKTGEWIKEREIDNETLEEVFDKIDLSKF